MTDASPSPSPSDASLDPQPVVEAMYQAFGAKDEARLRELLHPEVHWDQCDGFPGGAKRRGVEDVLAGVLRGNAALWQGFAAPVRELIAAGERVVALGHYEGVHSVTGRAMRAEFTHVYRVQDGRITHFEQVADTWPMVQAMGNPTAPA